TPNLVAQARGADVLVHEAQANALVRIMAAAARDAGESRAAKILADIPSYHTDPADAAEEAVAAGGPAPLAPPPPAAPDHAALRRIFRRNVAGAPPRGVVLGEDGTLIVLPTGSDAVKVTRLDP